MSRFLIALVLCSLLLYVGAFFMISAGILDQWPSYFWQTLAFLNFSTLVIYYYLLKRGKDMFVQLYLLTIVLKLLAYAGYNLLIILKDHENAASNVGFFMMTYLLFTTLELAFLYRRISQ